MTPKRFLGVIQRHAIIVWGVVAIGLALMFVFRNAIPNTYVGIAHVVLVADSGTARDPSVSIVDLPSIATSSVVLERVRNTLKLPVSLLDFKLGVGAAVLGRSSIMAVSYHDLHADRAISVANAVADELSHYYDEISTQRYDVDVDRLSGEMSLESTKIRQLEERLGKLVSQNPYVASDQSINILSTQLAALTSQRVDAYAALQGDRAVDASLAPNPNLSKIAHHEILANNPSYVAVQTVAATDNAQLATDRAGYTKGFPGLPGAIAKVASDKATLDSIAAKALADQNAFSAAETAAIAARQHQDALVAGDAAHVRELDALIASENARLRDLPLSGELYNQLKSQRDALDTEYTALAQRRANALANRAEASSLGSVVVLDRAIKADTQLTGGRTRAAILSLILVLAFAIGSAFVVESLDPRIRRAEEIEQLYGVPVIARFGAKA